MIARLEENSVTLVTGATGFTGRYLVRSLVSDGQRVRAVVRSSSRARELLPPEVEVLQGDLADPELVPRAMPGVQTVYHLAAVYREAKHTDLHYREVNVAASRRLLE